MKNRLPNSQLTNTGERTIRVDVAAVVAELHDASQALLRVAQLFERSLTNGRQPSAGNGRAAPSSVGDRLTTKQLGAIHSISRKAGLSREGLVSLLVDLAGKEDPALLSRSEASTVIDRLAAMTD